MNNPYSPLDSFESFRRFRDSLLQLQDPRITVLALEGLFRIDSEVESRQCVDTEEIRDFLRKFGNKMPIIRMYFRRLGGAGGAGGEGAGGAGGAGGGGKGIHFARTLTIFKTLKVPLFIDHLGDKKLLDSFETTDEITIDENTPIYHVTHREEAQTIQDEKKIRPSDNKNIIEGCWFGLKNPRQNMSVYGTRAFETTLSKLGVTRLVQGEIVSYKYDHEVNVILYADEYEEKKDFKVLKPTDSAVRSMNDNAYVHVSIFVPSEFLPDSDSFHQVIKGPFEVQHGDFCVRAKRSGIPCPELTC